MATFIMSSVPERTMKLNNGKCRVFYEITPTTQLQGKIDETTMDTVNVQVTVYQCMAVDLESYTYERLIEALIRERYTVSDELAILRQRDVKAGDFAAYNEWAEWCKLFAKQLFYIE